MVGRYDAGVSQGYGVVKKTNLNSITITGNVSVSGIVYGALTGEVVRKIGQTTGTTQGTVTAGCVDVPPGGGFPGVICAQAATYGSGPGDSGGAVFMPYNPAQPSSTPRTVGVHFASDGSTRYYSTIIQAFNAQDYAFFW